MRRLSKGVKKRGNALFKRAPLAPPPMMLPPTPFGSFLPARKESGQDKKWRRRPRRAV